MAETNPLYVSDRGITHHPDGTSPVKMTKIALLGAAGQIGTPLSLLCKAVSRSLKQPGTPVHLAAGPLTSVIFKSDLFDQIALYDIVHVPGIATDLNHIDSRAVVTGHLPTDNGLKQALQGADIVVVTAGIARCAEAWHD